MITEDVAVVYKSIKKAPNWHQEEQMQTSWLDEEIGQKIWYKSLKKTGCISVWRKKYSCMPTKHVFYTLKPINYSLQQLQPYHKVVLNTNNKFLLAIIRIISSNKSNNIFLSNENCVARFKKKNYAWLACFLAKEPDIQSCWHVLIHISQRRLGDKVSKLQGNQNSKWKR